MTTSRQVLAVGLAVIAPSPMGGIATGTGVQLFFNPLAIRLPAGDAMFLHVRADHRR